MSPSILPIHYQDAEKADRDTEANVPFSAKTALSARSTRSVVAVQGLDAVIGELRQTNHDVAHMYDGDDEDTDDEDAGKPGLKAKISHWRALARHFLHKPSFHYAVIGLVILDMIIVFIDLVVSLLSLPCPSDAQKQWFEEHGLHELPPAPRCKLHESPSLTAGEWFLWSGSIFLLSLFTVELIVSGIAFGLRHFKKPIYAVDAVVVVTSLVLEIIFKFGEGGKLETAPSAIITLRLWKIVRAVHAIAHSVELKNREIIKQVKIAKQSVEDVLEREQLRIIYLREKAPHIEDDELENFVDKEMKEKETKEKEKVSQSSDGEDASDKRTS